MIHRGFATGRVIPKKRATLRHGQVPADLDDGPAQVHQKSVSGAARARRNGGVNRRAAEQRVNPRPRAAAVRQIVDHPVCRIRQVGRSDNLEICREADRSVEVSRAVLNIDDDGILRITWVDLALLGKGGRGRVAVRQSQAGCI